MREKVSGAMKSWNGFDEKKREVKFVGGKLRMGKF